MTHFVINSCRCTGLTFAKLRQKSAAYAGDAETVMLETRAGHLCHRCRPWLIRAVQESCDAFEVDSEALADGDALLAHFGHRETDG